MRVEVAAEIGVSAGFVTAVINGKKRPGPKVLRYLQLEAFEAYRTARRPRPIHGLASVPESPAAAPT